LGGNGSDRAPWWNDTGELAQFGRWLTDTGQLRDPWEMVEKPWKWDSAHDTFLREDAAERWLEEQAAAEDAEWRDMQRRSAL